MAAGMPAAARLGFHERLFDWIVRRIADPRFQKWATRFPLTRPIARRSARSVFDLCAGFVYSQVLFACVRLRVFDALARAPLDGAALSRAAGLPPAAGTRLFDAAISLGLLSRLGDGRFSLGPNGAAVVANPGIAAMVEHHALVYRDLADPVALLRGDAERAGLNDFWAYARSARPETLADEDVAGYSALMTRSQPLVADIVLDACPLDAHRCLLDVGGGEGAFLRAAARRAPRLDLMLFDLPPVAARAERLFAEAGLGARVAVHGGSFVRDPLPAGADVVSLVRVLHDHDDAPARLLLERVSAALPRGGRLVVAEPMADSAGPTGSAYFGFYLLAMGQGRVRSRAEITLLMKNSGFKNIQRKHVAMPLLVDVLTAEKG